MNANEAMRTLLYQKALRKGRTEDWHAFRIHVIRHHQDECGEPLPALTIRALSSTYSMTLYGPVEQLVVSPDGRHLAIYSGQVLALWQLPHRALKWIWWVPGCQLTDVKIHGFVEQRCLIFSVMDKGRRKLYAQELDRMGPIDRYDEDWERLTWISDEAEVAVSSSTKTIAILEPERGLRLLSLFTREVTHELECPLNSRGLRISRAGTLLTWWTEDRLWVLNTQSLKLDSLELTERQLFPGPKPYCQYYIEDSKIYELGRFMGPREIGRAELAEDAVGLFITDCGKRLAWSRPHLGCGLLSLAEGTNEWTLSYDEAQGIWPVPQSRCLLLERESRLSYLDRATLEPAQRSDFQLPFIERITVLGSKWVSLHCGQDVVSYNWSAGLVRRVNKAEVHQPWLGARVSVIGSCLMWYRSEGLGVRVDCPLAPEQISEFSDRLLFVSGQTLFVVRESGEIEELLSLPLSARIYLLADGTRALVIEHDSLSLWIFGQWKLRCLKELQRVPKAVMTGSGDTVWILYDDSEGRAIQVLNLSDNTDYFEDFDYRVFSKSLWRDCLAVANDYVIELLRPDLSVGKTLVGHLHPITSVEFIESEQILISGDLGGQVFVWNLWRLDSEFHGE